MSKVSKNKVLAGCKDGTVYEICLRDFCVTKEHQFRASVTAIELLSGFMDSTYVVSQSLPSGYLDPRCKLEVIVSLPEIRDAFIEFQSIVVQAGNVNKILQNIDKHNEIILATQTGLFFVSVEEEKMPDNVAMDPRLRKEWCPEITLVQAEEHYFKGQRVSQVIQTGQGLLVALWEEPVYWLIDRFRKIQIKIKDTSTYCYCTDLVLLETGRFKKFPKVYRNSLAIARTLNGIQLINIKGNSVHTIKTVKNTIGRT